MKMSLSASWLKKPIVIALVTSMCIALAVSMGIGIAENPATTITLSPDSGYGNTIVTVSGSGFSGSSTVEVYFAGMPVLSTWTGSDGSFTGQFIVPTDCRHPDDTYKVVAVDKEGIRAAAPFTVIIDPMLTDIENKLDQLLGITPPPPPEGLTGEIPIGALLPLTGDHADWGEASKAAIKLAVGEVNELLGEAGAPWTLKVLFRDTERNPDVALTKLKRLFNNKGVQFVIGPMWSFEVAACKAYADANEILVVSQSSTSPALAEDDFIFRFIPDDRVQGRAIARLMCDDEISTVVAVYRSDMWSVVNVTETRFEELTGDDFAEEMPYDPKAPDFPALAEDLANAVDTHGADGVLYIGFDEEAVDFFTEAKEYPDLWSPLKWYGSSLTALSKALLDPAVAEFCAETGFINMHACITRSDKYDRVHDALAAQLGREPDEFAYVAYDIVWALTYSLSLVNRYDSVAVRAVLPEVTESLFGASGWIVLNEAGDRAFSDYDLWIIVEVDTGVYEWKHVGTYHYYTDSITRLP